jgi:hypothetical protein
MSMLRRFFGKKDNEEQSERLCKAEAHMRAYAACYRDYTAQQAAGQIARWTNAQITPDEAATLIRKIQRD